MRSFEDSPIGCIKQPLFCQESFTVAFFVLFWRIIFVVLSCRPLILSCSAASGLIILWLWFCFACLYLSIDQDPPYLLLCFTVQHLCHYFEVEFYFCTHSRCYVPIQSFCSYSVHYSILVYNKVSILYTIESNSSKT